MEGGKISSQTEKQKTKERGRNWVKCPNYMDDDITKVKYKGILPSISSLLLNRPGIIPRGNSVFHQKYLFQGRVLIPEREWTVYNTKDTTAKKREWLKLILSKYVVSSETIPYKHWIQIKLQVQKSLQLQSQKTYSDIIIKRWIRIHC